MKVRRGASSIKVMGILVGKLKLNPEVKGALSRNSAKLGNYKLPVILRET